ncbi:MAG TPA: hypothetical protein VKS01_02035 [Bryobacteraceae bacterium]|nr:hypothetical protein [Bryobacteraceae bacterium]
MPIPAELWNRDVARCRGCGQTVAAAVFPAIDRTRAGAQPEAVQADTEASCFYHPSSRAAIPCEQCGRFLCNLCDIEIDGRHLCPRCFETGVSSNQLKHVETSRTMYDSIALALATWPILLFWPAIVSAPASLFVVVRRWRAPSSIVPRTRVRYYLAALLALAEIAGVVFLIYAIVRTASSIPPPPRPIPRVTP